MGINGLLPLLKSIHKPCNLKKFEGKTLGVDAYGWLHRGTVACAMELAMGKPTRKFVDFAMHRVRMLIHFGVIPYIIFDGDYLPSKAATEADRAKRRDESKRTGLELLKAGKTSQAYQEFQKAVDVTPEMARQLINELRRTGVQYIVAPYEADAQMVYLERKGIIDGILSEDSDLLVFGAKCLLTKLDQYGNCIEVNKADFCACREISLTGWSDVEFRRMAILSGCDYLSSINNMGLKTAYRMVRKHKTIEKVLRMLQFDGKFHVPKGYIDSFYQAEFTFLHQRVFCPEAQRLVFHTEPDTPIDEDKMPFLGAFVEPEIAQGVARGDLHPMTKLPIRLAQGSTISCATPKLASNARPLRSASVSDSKKGKPIETFFKPKRTPLAELDINCFTPSPSQQAALQRNSGPWQAIPLPRPYLAHAVTEPQQPQSAPAPARTTGRPHIRTPTISEPRPPKRARLCEDTEVVNSPNSGPKIELSRSKFFSAPEPSPTIGKKFRARRGKKEDITIFSDDSIEDALLSLPDFDGFTNQGGKDGKKITIFAESGIGSGDAVRERSSQTASLALMDQHPTSQTTDPGMTSDMSASSSFEQPATPTEITPLPSLGELKSRFSFVAQSTPLPKSNVVARNPPTPPTLASQRPSRIPLAIKPSVTILKGSTLSVKPSLTPLQRMGASAINRSKLPTTPPMTPLFAAKTKSPRRSLLSKSSVPFPEATGEKKLGDVEPALIPLPAVNETENLALMQNGSEDLIIHDSEDDEALSPISSNEGSRVNFSQFVYARGR